MKQCLMQSCPLVSVIIPVYNASEFIDACLESVMKQNYRNLEIIIENDGSHDDSLLKCQHWQARDDRIVIENHDNWGVSKARNHALNLCRGTYVVFIDADDVVSEDFIFCLVNALEKTEADCSAVNIASGKIYSDTAFSNGSISVETGINTIKSLFDRYHGFLCNKMFQLNIIRKYDLCLDENIMVSEDLLFNVRYLQHCCSVAYYDGVKYFYRQHSQSAMNRLDNPKWFDILDVYGIIMQEMSSNQEWLSLLSFQYQMILIEAKHRYHKIKNKNILIEIKIQQGENLISNSNFKFTLKKKMKILVFKLFPEIVMRYKRRFL